MFSIAHTLIFSQTGSSATIAHNEVSAFLNTGIATGWSWGFSPTQNHGISVTQNHIHHLGVLPPLPQGAPPTLSPAASGNMRTADMGCIYNLGVSAGLLVDHNLCHDTAAATYGAWGLYLDEGTSDATFSNNIIFNTYAASVHLHYGSNLTITNNVLALSQAYPCNTSGGVYCDASSFMDDPPSANEASSNFSFSLNIVLLGAHPNSTAISLRERYSFNEFLGSNVYWASNPAGITGRPLFEGQNFSSWQRSDFDVDSALADPLFANAASYDFTDLLPGSPALVRGFIPVDVSSVGPRKPW